MNPSLPPLPLPDAIRSSLVDSVNGLTMHTLEAGERGKPVLLLLHGFPELAFSWRGVMPALAAAGYHVIAPDLRGYGRTTGWSGDYDADIRPFGFMNLVKDLVALLDRLGIERVHCLIGHDFGSPLAAYAALTRPDLFRRLVMMSAPFAGAPGLGGEAGSIHADLLALDPPRKHYQWYYAERGANTDILSCSEGLGHFLRAYYHAKSADDAANEPVPLAGWSAGELASLPLYYMMRADQTMPQSVAPRMPSALDCRWMSAEALDVYTLEYARTGFQGGLNWYRCSTSPTYRAEYALFYGKPISIPCWFIAGRADWGIYQSPGAFERMQSRATQDFRGVRLIDHAGHWVQQEQAAATASHLIDIAAAP